MNKSLKEQMIKLFDDGWNYTQIASKLDCSKGTISYHLTSFIKERKKQKKEFIENIKNNLPKDREEFINLYSDKLTFREKQYFFNTFYKLPNMATKKGNVPNEYYRNKRYRIKKEMVEYKGGSCELCGYNKSFRALQFHHIDPTEKDFNIGGVVTFNEDVKMELDKCMLVCANCHSEIHDNNMAD
jgi:DNA replicative helicase MCM subunit Mcm2 (Cdc46/Mcm family)